MTLKLKPLSPASSQDSFSWDDIVTSPPAASPSTDSAVSPPPTSWLSAQDMKTFGAEPLRSEPGTALVKCSTCDRPVLASAMAQHLVNCEKIQATSAATKKGNAVKGKEDEPNKKTSNGNGNNNKKRKADSEDADEAAAAGAGPKKKAKAAPKVTKGRLKGPIDLDRQCGVMRIMHDKDTPVPCSRSLTCKTHSMGLKRAVQGRSKPYDELLLEWNRAHNPNFVEPVKRETKAERKEKRDAEREAKKREKEAAAAAASAAGGGGATGGAGSGGGGEPKPKKPKNKPKAAATGTMSVTASNAASGAGGGAVYDDDGEDVDSEGEVDSLVHAYRNAMAKGIVAVPLAVPCDAGSWFVARRERFRNCRDLLASALMPRTVNAPGGAPPSFMAGRPPGASGPGTG